HGRLEAERPRHLEAHLRRVDGVVLAVEAGDLHVDDGIAEHAAVLHRLDNALLDGGDELTRDGAADDLVDELEAGPSLLRLDAHERHAELAVAARPLLVLPLRPPPPPPSPPRP